VLLAQIIVNGLLIGGLYGLMALGMALVWGVLNIVIWRTARSSCSALRHLLSVHLAGIDPFAALPVAMLIMFAFGT